MLLRLKTFVVEAMGEIFTRKFWKELVRQSLKSMVFSAAEAGLQAVSRVFTETAQRVRSQNAGPMPDTSRTQAASQPYRPAHTPPAPMAAYAADAGLLSEQDWRSREPRSMRQSLHTMDQSEFSQTPEEREEADRQAHFDRIMASSNY